MKSRGIERWGNMKSEGWREGLGELEWGSVRKSREVRGGYYRN